MNINAVLLNINSDQPQELLRFYRDVVGLPPHPDANRESTLMAGPLELVFDSHSKVKGAAPQPERALLNLMVDDIAAEEARMEAAGVQFIRKQGREYWGGVISTFVDPDGNYAQLIQFKPE